MKIKKLIKRIYYRLNANFTTEDLVKKGLVVGKNFTRMHGVILDPSHVWLIEIGDNVRLGPRVHILAHDGSTKQFLNYTRIGNVKIGNNVFIGADSVVLPDVTIVDNVIVGANSTISKSLLKPGVYAGSPAKYIKSYDDYVDSCRAQLNKAAVFDSSYQLGKITSDKKIEMKEMLKEKKGYII